MCKVASSHNEANTFSKKLGTNFLTLPIGICINWQSLIDTQIAFLFWFLFYLGLKYNHCVIGKIISNIQNQLQEHTFEQLLVYLFKSNSLGSMHLNPLVGRSLDIA